MAFDAALPDLTTVAEGTSAGGPRWTIKAGGTPADCLTVLYVETSAGWEAGGGLGGPALSRSLMNISWHRTDRAGDHLVGRVDPSIERVRVQLTGAGAATIDLEPAGDPVPFGVRFLAAILPIAARIASVSALDADGRVVAHEDLGRQADLLDRRPGDPGSGWQPS